MDAWLTGTFFIAVLVIFLIVFFAKGFRWALGFLFNALLGYLALWATQAWLIPDLVVNIWSVLIVAIFGIAGYIAVLILHFLGLWF